MIKILIVDDEKPICDLIDMNLSAAGYFCKSVQDGMDAIEFIEREKFDLVLLDIMLPGADGFDIMEYIRPLQIPVIFITAKSDVKDKVMGLKLGSGTGCPGGSGAAPFPENRKPPCGRGYSGRYGSKKGNKGGKAGGSYQ